MKYRNNKPMNYDAETIIVDTDLFVHTYVDELIVYNAKVGPWIAVKFDYPYIRIYEDNIEVCEYIEFRPQLHFLIYQYLLRHSFNEWKKLFNNLDKRSISISNNKLTFIPH